jgi:hypothetical protein
VIKTTETEVKSEDERMDEVSLLWHVHEVDGADDEKLIGVYRDAADAKAAIGRLRNKPGFAIFPDGFQISRYELNRDHWTEGFVPGAA